MLLSKDNMELNELVTRMEEEIAELPQEKEFGNHTSLLKVADYMHTAPDIEKIIELEVGTSTIDLALEPKIRKIREYLDQAYNIMLDSTEAKIIKEREDSQVSFIIYMRKRGARNDFFVLKLEKDKITTNYKSDFFQKLAEDLKIEFEDLSESVLEEMLAHCKDEKSKSTTIEITNSYGINIDSVITHVLQKDLNELKLENAIHQIMPRLTSVGFAG
jgi:hypothetical protein